MNNLRRLRTTKKITQQKLAEAVGVTQAAIASYENDIRTPSVNVLKKLAHALGVTMDELVEGREAS
ncbi:MAG: helix-turn-helix transcriptional regulator [Clostridiales bacterium]|nr:helix-turn-helix transcriptional regulator [Clostridiales bacterium]